MREVSLGETAETAQSRRHELLGLIRGACEALLSTQPSTISAVTVSGAIEGRDSVKLLRVTSSRLAQEYGLRADAKLTKTGFAVRLTRSAEPLCGEKSVSPRAHD